MQNIFTRIVDAETNPLDLGTAINIYCDSNRFVVRLLSANDKVDLSSCFDQEDILTSDSIKSQNIKVKINNVAYYITDELIFDLQKESQHFLKPLSNYLILLQNNKLELVNFQLETAFSHYRVPQYIRYKSDRSQCICLAQIYSINAKDSFDKCCKSITRFNNVPLITNLIDDNAIIENTKQVVNNDYSSNGTSGRNRLQAYLTLEPLSESVKAEDKVLVKVSCMRNGEVQTNANFTVCLEAVDGYLPHSRVRLENGTATFAVYAMLLDAGESIRVKAGLHHYRGMAECVIPVVANDKAVEIRNYVTQEELQTAIVIAKNEAIASAQQNFELLYSKLKDKLYELQQELYDRTSA